ncbi:DmsC/YnfH family molybdoenzyme membrane anchor subunit [Aggregatibacter actinomycetemcomitans]|uniref:DmsC/YnfH family molybdoenzyme membrane anchor subunit n=1 Tax=Aggregatibacter actinomycetemcomitans TaxID=714 RepID=UPI00197C0EC4|nr:DmsC/YnfH family molybdoenzyme membrane anchor subunit [Aggregatibacter actinomycetemcomitans]MBN6064381.1 dimethyl sulfoxide reductase anchor subunit [Aggregatibacter actinomycetemcomitans]MBN6082126.1 dimethyl sulfoxide reductase anchor subunit [Aggregatibacter actinomycetemcomitans]MBN6084318.1 dimethyl sulfoxide reductase anchor subunit [Aggregatibacter actinomycetemcomitans]
MSTVIHELPLVVFTVLAQSAVGSWLVFSFVLCTSSNAQNRHYLHKVMFVILALLGIGFAASVLHLGTPIRAFNSLNRVGESMMSNEIASGALFFAMAGMYWLLAIMRKMPLALDKLWLVITSLIGLVFMVMMDQVYHIPSVPTWNTPITSCLFYGTVALGGIALSYALLMANPQRTYQLSALPWLFSLAVLFAAIVAVYQGFALPQIHSAIQNAAALVPNYAAFSALRFCCLALAALFIFRSKNITVLALAVILTLFAEMLGRNLFYGTHMTLGMAVGG